MGLFILLSLRLLFLSFRCMSVETFLEKRYIKLLTDNRFIKVISSAIYNIDLFVVPGLIPFLSCEYVHILANYMLLMDLAYAGRVQVSALSRFMGFC